MTAADPTPPEAPVTRTRSPAGPAARWSRFSAVPYEHGTAASWTSDRSDSIRYVSADGTRTNCAKPPSTSDPSHGSRPSRRSERRQPWTITRSPIRAGGDAVADGHDLAADVGALDPRERHGASPAQLPPEYQPIRVLMSVLLTPAARTAIRTSPGPAPAPGRRAGTRASPGRRGRGGAPRPWFRPAGTRPRPGSPRAAPRGSTRRRCVQAQVTTGALTRRRPRP